MMNSYNSSVTRSETFNYTQEESVYNSFIQRECTDGRELFGAIKVKSIKRRYKKIRSPRIMWHIRQLWLIDRLTLIKRNEHDRGVEMGIMPVTRLNGWLPKVSDAERGEIIWVPSRLKRKRGSPCIMEI